MEKKKTSKKEGKKNTVLKIQDGTLGSKDKIGEAE